MSDLLTTLRSANPSVEIWAAGGIVVRRPKQKAKILMVHRPRYDDWSLPKGKLEDGESLEEAALREVQEETGYSCTLVEPLPLVRYRDANRRRKAVVYWIMRVDSGEFVPNKEVDEIRWLSTERAMKVLDYDHDIELVRNSLVGILQGV